MPSKRFLSTAAPLALLALAGMGLATAQSNSPFASGKKTQAWEQPAQGQSWQAPAPLNYAAPQPAPNAAPQQLRSQVMPGADAPIATAPRRPAARRAAPAYTSSSTKTPPKTFGGQSAPTYTNYAGAALAGSAPPPSGYTYKPPTRTAQAPDFGSPTPPQSSPPASAPPQPRYGTPAPAPAPTSGSPYAPRAGTTPRRQAWENYPQNPQPAQQQPAPQYGSPAPAYGQSTYGQSTPPQGYQSPTPPQGAPNPGSPYYYPPSQEQPGSWKDKLGLGSIATVLRGAFTLGAAATNRNQPDGQLGPDDGWSEDFIGDADLEFEASAITQGGLEYGVNLGARAQYDPYRRGFGGQTPDCPPTIAGCSGQAAGLASGLRGHTSGFYSGGEDITKDAQVALESAHIFLRSAYGDVTVGRDDGAAYLFSLGAPTLLAVGASNSPVDYTGYDSVKTVNDASGFAEKITYTSPRLLGDQIGVGVQLGLSYALDADVCGVDYCNGKNIAGVIQPEIEDVMEAGLALDRTFENGLSVELTGTYARGSEKSGLAGLDDLESFGTGLEFGYGDWTLGGSWLKSNNGLLDGDYSAYDAGLTWQPGALGFTLGYGHAKDENIGLKSDQGTFGITYDFDKFTLGTGVQYVDREVSGVELGLPTTLDQKATSVFIQGGFKF